MAAGTSNAAAAASGGLPRTVSGLLIALLIVAPVAVLYLALPLQNYTDAKDSLSYAYRIREGIPVFHANHLLYEPLNFLLHRAAAALFGPVDPLRTMQLLSTFTAIPTLLLICRIAQRWGGEFLPGAVAVGAIAFSFGIWCYSISADGYLPPLFCVMLTIALLDPARWAGDGAVAPSLKVVFLAALATAAAVLIHQMYVFFAITAGLIMLRTSEFGPLAVRFRGFLIYGGVSGGIVIAAYAAVYLLTVPAGESFLDWLRGYAAHGFYYGRPPSLLSPLLGGLGALTSMLSMNGILTFDVAADAASRWFPAKSLFEERFIAETAIGRPIATLVLLAMTVSVAAWAALAWQAGAGWQARRRAAVRAPFTDCLLLSLIILYTLLVLIWEPVNREFWIHVYVFATLLCAMNARLLRRAVRLTAAALCGALFIANFFGAIRPLADADADYWRVLHRHDFAGVPAAGYDAVLISCNFLCMNYVRYFHTSNVVVPDLQNPRQFVTDLARYAPERILVSKWFLTPHASYIDPVTQLPVDAKRYAAVLDVFRKAYPQARLPVPGAAALYRFENGQLVPAGK